MEKKTTKIIVAVVLLVLGFVSFRVVGDWADTPENYTATIETINKIETDALALTAVATGAATLAAVVPGDATTPIANKLADIAGYMVIVFITIVIEKYLLAIMGIAAFKILIPIALVLVALSLFISKEERKTKIQKGAAKIALLAVLLWVLVPTSAMITNVINETYDVSFQTEQVDAEVEEATSEAVEEEGFSLGQWWNDVKDKTSATVEKFEDALNELIEGVAVMIVTTVAIPIAVIFLFIWILKTITGLDIKMPSAKNLPKASKLLPKKEEKLAEDEA